MRERQFLRIGFIGVVLGGMTLFSGGLLAGVGVAGGDTVTSGGPVNPTANIAPVPALLSSGSCTSSSGVVTCENPCVSTTGTWPVLSAPGACDNYVLTAINNARAYEGVGAMVLPSNWSSLSIQEQLFVLANLERTARGYPAYLGLNAALSAAAEHAAALASDPTAAPGFAVGTDSSGFSGIGGAWSQGYNTLVADYYWMYSDGWSGSTTSNIDCTGPSAPGCWGHRDELLGSAPGYNPGVGLGCTTCEMGAGYAVVGGSSSYVDLIELPAGDSPAMTFTWASEVGYFADGALSGSAGDASTLSQPNASNGSWPTTVPARGRVAVTTGVRAHFVSINVRSTSTSPVEITLYAGPGCSSALSHWSRGATASLRVRVARGSYSLNATSGDVWSVCSNVVVH
jgi:hypothetical protein